MTDSGSSSKIATVLRVTSGNFLEMFDFFLFGFYATYISKAFFPAGSESAGLMLTFLTFGAGFLMRPLGVVLLGAYVDRIGRRRGLTIGVPSHVVWKWPERVASGAMRLAAVRRRGQAGGRRPASARASASRPACAW